jgi:hypothetical protein
MNRFNQTAQRVPSIVLKAMLWGVALGVACLVHPYLGLAGLVLFAVWLVRGHRAPDPNWDPNVHGENAYQILGVDGRADGAAIRRAFRRLQQEYHPDAAAPDRKAEATAVFIRIGRAYELLSDREKRFQYDGLIEDLEGRIPPFTEAYNRIKDEDKHPLYAVYDALYGDRRDGRGPDEDDPAVSEPPAAGPTGAPAEAPAASEPAGPAVEVEMPEAVREALGLPPAAGKGARGGPPP